MPATLLGPSPSSESSADEPDITRERRSPADAPGVGVYYDAERDLVLASDMNTGLWILRVTA